MKAVRRTSLALAATLGLGLVSWAQDVPPAGQEKPGTTQDEEAKRRALEALAGRQEVRVTIQKAQATVKEIIDEFRRQVPYMNFVLDAKGWPDEFRIDEFIVKNEPWRSALNAFLQKAEGAAEEESPTLLRISRPPRVTFAFKEAPIKTVVDLIARMSGANIVVHPDVQGLVTMSVNNVPWNAVLDAVVQTVGDYRTVRENYGIIRIIPAAELLKQMETKLWKLKYILPPPVYRASIEEGRFFKGKPVTPPTSVQELETQFTLLNILRGILTRDASGTQLGTISYDPTSNTITVRDTKVVLNQIDEMLKAIDQEPAQVMVEVKFISTVNEDLLNFGVDWSFQGESGVGFRMQPIMPSFFGGPDTGPGAAAEGPFTQAFTGKVTRLPFGLGREASPADQFFLTQYDMLATFRAFKRDRFTKVIQGPTLSVLDNTEATIFVGEEVPYAETRAQTNQFGGLEFTIAEGTKSPVRIGFQLMVVPKLVPETNRVILTVIPINEFLSGTGTGQGLIPGFERFTISGAGQGGSDATIDLPRVATTTLVTRLMMESGRTAVLGGLVNERSTYEERKVPILGDIPLINYLFKSRSDTVRREHLLIFITPRIVRSTSQTEESLRELLKEHMERERRELEKIRERDARDSLKKAEEMRAREKSDELPK